MLRRGLAVSSMWSPHRPLHVLLLLYCCVSSARAGHVFFSPGNQYHYRYEGISTIKDAGVFRTVADATIIPLSPMVNNTRQHCKLEVRHFFIYVLRNGEEQQPDLDDQDYSKWMSFYVTSHGEVERVFFPPSEHPRILALKKILLSTFSSRLMVSDQALSDQQRWAYGASETGHEGKHNFTYQAEPMKNKIVYTKTRTSQLVHNAKESHTKIVHFQHSDHVPSHLSVTESFASPNTLSPDYKPILPERADAEGDNYDLPAMQGSANVSLILKKITTRENYMYENLKMPEDLKNSSLEIGKMPEPLLPLDTMVFHWIDANLTCVVLHDLKGLDHPTPCFNKLFTVLRRLTLSDLNRVSQIYFNDGTASVAHQYIIIDALAAAHTNDSWEALTTNVLMVDPENPELILRALVAFVAIEDPPPQITLDTIENRVFKNPYMFSDPDETRKVNDRAMLVLGSLVHTMRQYQPEWSNKIIREVETQLGVHDPWQHRHAREVFTQEELDEHLTHKSLRILTMGNAQADSSFQYIVSYLNESSDTHILLKSAAVEALGGYHHQAAADLLLTVALTDTEDNVRRMAVHKFSTHPNGGNLENFINEEMGLKNITSMEEHRRMKRGVLSTVARIFQGFQWKLETPGMDWRKKIGGSQLGGSFGLVISNVLDIDIKPLSGHLKADVYDTAYATLHLGFIGMDLDFFRAELCFKGGVEYNLNILAEYGFDSIEEFANIYENVVVKVIDMIKSTVKNFRSLMVTYKGYSVKDILNDFVESVKTMPNKILNLKQIARKISAVISEYSNLPDIVQQITDLSNKVKTLFTDIKNDVMKLYNSIVDTVTVTIPWAWDEIKTSFNKIGDALRVIVTSPKSSINSIGTSIKRISFAVAQVIEAKNKIQAANIFDKEKRPYWFDLPEVFSDIWTDVLEIKNATISTINWLSTDAEQNEKAKAYTGKSLVEMKNDALKKILQVLEKELAEPVTHLKRLLAPFTETYAFFKDTITNVKDGWALLVKGYKEARTQLDLIFGPKFHQSFPKKYLLSSSCGDGFWESTGAGQYDHPGVDVTNETWTAGHPVSAPFHGALYVNSSTQVTIVAEYLYEVDIIIDNVQADDKWKEIEGQQIEAGGRIGVLVRHPRCSDVHVHLALRKRTTGSYINPTRFMESREITAPKWVQHCNHYLLVYKFKTISQGKVTGNPDEEDQTPPLDESAASGVQIDNIEGAVDGSRKKRSIFNDISDAVLGQVKDLTSLLGLNITTWKDVFSIKMNDITVNQALGVLDKVGLSSVKTRIISILKKVEDIANDEECVRPDSMDEKQLKAALILRGKNPQGARQTLIKRYLESEPRCFNIEPKLRDNIYCQFDTSCLSMSCCVDLEFFIYRHALVASMSYDPCALTLTLLIGQWTAVVNLNSILPIEESGPVVAELNVLNVAQLTAYYKVESTDSYYVVSLGVSWCSTKTEICDNLILFLEKAQLPKSSCDPNVSPGMVVTLPSGAPNVDEMLEMNISQVMELVDNVGGLSEETLKQLTDDLREAFKQWLMDKIDEVLLQLFGNQFNRFEICLKGYSLSYGPYKVKFFETTIRFAIGPVPCYFYFGLHGFYGADFQCTLCIMSMKAEAKITPRIGSSATGELGVDLWVFRAGLRLTAYILTTSFPTRADIYFNKFPLDVRARMDLQLIPLRIELHVFLIFELRLPWGKKIRKTLINKRLWFYQSPAINKEIFNINNAEPDNTPPDFSMYSKAVEAPEEGGEWKENRKKRSLDNPFATTNRCSVKQIANRDYTEPGFVIELEVNDDRSSVTMTFCVGTFPSGCDVIKNEELGGSSTIIIRTMTAGRKLFITVTAKNSQGGAATATCELPTYDMTLPTGRVTAEFRSTSHPEKMYASILATDDSKLIEEKVSNGYGRGFHGWQNYDWSDIATTEVTDGGLATGNDPFHLRALEKYTTPLEGILSYNAFFTATYSTPQLCAKECSLYPESKCLSFCYDYSEKGTCYLYEALFGHGLKLHRRSLFHYFERLGVGRTANVRLDKLQLHHGTINYMNVYFKNTLDYEQIISSEAVITDFTPPYPGLIVNASLDEYRHEACESFMPEHLKRLCIEETPLDNFRHIIDGEGSKTLFNGIEPMSDEKYTRANRMIAANWDAIHDNETGILIYTWSVGTSHCEDDIHPHKDPHAHLYDESEWTHVGVAFPLNLPDDEYHISIIAMNKIEFGGPMGLLVCHSTPYIVDTTPPVIHEVHSVRYNETSYMVTAVVNATDASGIAKTWFGLGRSRRDTFLLDYVEVANEIVSYVYKIPDGIPAWVKIRVCDMVMLCASGHSRKPIIVDLSAPFFGVVFDGPHKGKDIQYQSSTHKLCISWDGFYDPESGIIVYQIGLGTSALLDDVVALVNVSYETTQYCFENLDLTHKSIYYGMVIAWNGGAVERSANSSSDGVSIDTTPPEFGIVIDGDDESNDVQFTSDSASVKAAWRGFDDPESGHMSTQWNIYRKSKGSSAAEVLLHKEENVNDTQHFLDLHHFHLHHGDRVRSEMNVTNKALLSTTATSDGFTVDLTDPVMTALVDGPDVNDDMQYSSSMTTLSAAWSFRDDESGIKEYRITAYEHEGRTKRKLFPKSTIDWMTMDGSSTLWSESVLPLQAGRKYSIRLIAINGAGLSAVHFTDGVIIDPSPPQMLYVHGGVLAGSSEELIDGVILHNDPDGIQASWAAIDPESGIKQYIVAVGTEEGSDDVSSWRSMGMSTDGYLDGLKLELTDKDTGLPLYYVSVKSLNGAGMESTVRSSSPIKVVSDDKEGVVRDGPDKDIDIDYQLNGNTITVTFAGFESERDGIVEHQVAVGTKPGYDDVMEFTSDDIISKDVAGIGSEGHAQFLLDLIPDVKNYVSVRAITGAGNALDSSSDGFIVDGSIPLVEVENFGEPVQESYPNTVVYQGTVESLRGDWTCEDLTCPITNVTVMVGSAPGFDDIAYHQFSPDISSLPNNLVVPQIPGLPNVMTVTGLNMVGLANSSYSQTVVIDTTAPSPGVVECPHVVSGDTAAFTCNWLGFQEHESEIDHYQVGVGVAPGDDGVIMFTSLKPHIRQYSFEGSPLEHQKLYYVTVRAINRVNLEIFSSSTEIVVDETPPKGGWVIEISDIVDITNAENICSDGSEFCPAQDVECQRSLSQIAVAWQSFSDDESAIVRYEAGVGTIPGGTQLHDFHQVTGNHAVITNLDLVSVKQVFVTIKAYNEAGLYSTAISNGVYISRISAGLEPLGVSYVYDGISGPDLEFQDDNERLGAHWDFSGDPCPIVKYDLSIQRVDGLVLSPFEEIPVDQTMAEVDELELRDGETYFFIVRATNKLGYVYSIPSNGATVRLEPLLPGIVRDGNIPGKDLNFQPSTTSLSASWHGFGYDKNEEQDYIFNDDPTVDAEIGQHEKISFYEVAAGTDRRFPKTRDNIHPFVNVGLNRTWTFDNLKTLIPKTSTYYITVRAHAHNTAVVEVTSNGVKVGYGGHVLQLGTLALPRYIPSTTEISFTWDGFEFLVPIMKYQYGISSTPQDLSVYDCSDIQIVMTDGEAINTLTKEFETFFDIVSLTDIDKNTAVNKQSLSLSQNKMYQVVVMAYDESGVCALISGNTTVDNTPPEEGIIGVGPDFPMSVLYTSDSKSLDVWWSGYKDEESGISSVNIGLYQDNCAKTIETNIKPIETLPFNETSIKYFGLELQSGIAYFVKLTIKNNAGLLVETKSKPIILDQKDPSAGDVHDGSVFSMDIQYQHNVNSLKGTILYLPSAEEDCPYTIYSLFAKHQDWSNIIHGNLRAMPHYKIKNTHFLDKQVSYDDNNGVVINVERSIAKDIVMTGALETTTQLLSLEEYQVEMKMEIVNDISLVSSVSFWSGPKGLPMDLDIPLYDNDTRWNNDSLDSTYFEILETPLEGDTYIETFDENLLMTKAFGFQIHKGAIVDGVQTDLVVLWSSDGTFVRHLQKDLGYRFTDVFHTYKIKVFMDKENGDIPLDGCQLLLYVDGELSGFLSGTVCIGPDVNVQLMGHTYRGTIPKYNDEFKPPSGNAYFRNIRFPPDRDAACRYGKPFKGGDHAIMEFHAAVGTSPEEHDVQEFVKVAKPCIPCQEPCNIDKDQCQPTCNAKNVQELSLAVNNLNLVSLIREDVVENSTSSIAAPYFLFVKGITGSGRSVTSVSNGIYIDPTPPVISGLYHLDASWNTDEPSDFQGNDHTIALYYEAGDDESEITSREWAIGTDPLGSEDILPFTGIDSDFVMKQNLSLENNMTYYASVRCTNAAGLVATVVSKGVTVMLDTPDVSGTSTSLPGTEQLGSEGSKAVKTSSQSDIKVKWEEPKAQNIDAEYVGIGTDEKTSDVFPSRQVGYNSSGELHISNEGINMGEDAEAGNLTDARNKERRRRSSDQLLLPPGTVLHIHLKACNKAHKCGEVPVKQIIIIRDKDQMGERNPDGTQTLLFEDLNIGVKTVNAQPSTCSLIGGVLSQEDLQAEYKSDASGEFKSYVRDLETSSEKTDRDLYQRIRLPLQKNFYLSSSCNIQGPIEISVPFEIEDVKQGDVEPKLLSWCAKSQMWVDVGKSCDPNGSATINWESQIMKIMFCGLDTLCDYKSATRSKRAIDSSLVHPSTFALAAVDVQFVNNPPVITSESEVPMDEDEGTSRIKIIAEDPDGDDVIILLNTTIPLKGNATLTKDNWLIYRPCENCDQSESVFFTVIEKRTDGKAALTTTGFIKFKIKPVNDNPVVMVIKNGRNGLSETSDTVILLVEENNIENIVYKDLDILLLAYDPDATDLLTFEYEAPSHGNVTVFKEVKNVTFSEADCALYSTSKWNEVTHNIKQENMAVMIPKPCDTDVDLYTKGFAWSATVISFKPSYGFYGNDEIKVLSRDSIGTPSELAKIVIKVLNNPCRNRSRCFGPEFDPDCTKAYRSQGFEQYGCECLPGHTGRFCDEDLDECASDPCPDNFTCIDSFNNYTCSFDGIVQEPTEETVVEYYDNMNWLYGLIAAIVVVIVIIGISLTVYCSRAVKEKKQKSKERRYLHHGRSPSPSSPTVSSDNMRRALFNNRFSTKPKDQVYDNPLFNHNRWRRRSSSRIYPLDDLDLLPRAREPIGYENYGYDEYVDEPPPDYDHRPQGWGTDTHLHDAGLILPHGIALTRPAQLPPVHTGGLYPQKAWNENRLPRVDWKSMDSDSLPRLMKVPPRKLLE